MIREAIFLLIGRILSVESLYGYPQFVPNFRFTKEVFA